MRSAQRSSATTLRGSFSSRNRASTRSRHASQCLTPRHSNPARALTARVPPCGQSSEGRHP
eukprot:6962449-Alexandrium_andersonii.AAC.1